MLTGPLDIDTTDSFAHVVTIGSFVFALDSQVPTTCTMQSSGLRGRFQLTSRRFVFRVTT